ncbi:hypothetical protein GWI33_018564 [Rhynchophorus ferrugineus]|uniref:Proteasome assembly chaperone 2 n=1 Tax=Rhynchophorus ferrugineus TaxID=354439 RepID=A0A834HXL6_RHYFE|nr:hypothetical protein GWI33_018564 [Rhynchophorus ferrugineus]
MVGCFNIETGLKLAGFTLVIPSISIGNVPQLTVDLLIASLNLDKSISVWHPAIVNSVGSDPYNIQSAAVSTACQLYYNDGLKLAVLQFRTTFDRRRIGIFLSDLLKAIVKLEFKKIVILSSLFDYELTNIRDKENLFYATSGQISEDIIKSVKAKVLEKDQNGYLLISGAGLARKLYNMLENKVECTLLVKYVSEGDNTSDSKVFLKQLLQFIPIDSSKLKITIPPSWSYINGGPPSLGIF